MRVDFHKDFKKNFDRLSPKLQIRAKARIKLFAADPDDALLRRHQLRGSMSDYWSINISGDHRALYQDRGASVLFIKIGTHSELYG